MKARAPGKLVLSGAYAVLEGAPALVTAVDRYVVADSEREAIFVSPEVQQACEARFLARPCWFDASALRRGDRKLGLGSSAAILVASIGASVPATVSGAELPDQVLPMAMAAHRAAQPGGSGVDVAAACHGGVLRCCLEGERLRVEQHRLPAGLAVEVWACGGEASTQRMLAAVAELRSRQPRRYDDIMGELREGSREAAEAGEPGGLLAALERQLAGLAELGAAAGVPIVTAQVVGLQRWARSEDACFYPSGAGGGDVAVYAGTRASSQQFRARAVAAGLCLLEISTGARGLHRVGFPE